VICQHDLREMFNGGECLLAGNTYVCEDQIPSILSEKCIDIDIDHDESSQVFFRLCGKKLIKFLNGTAVEVPSTGQILRVVTGNDLPMLDSHCIVADGYKVCWEDGSVAKPFDFINNRCSVDPQDGQEGQLNCLGPLDG